MSSRRRYPRHPYAWWQATTARFLRSGLTAEAFAQTINVHPQSLERWRRQFAADARARPAGLAVSDPPQFVEVSVAAPSVLEPAVALRVAIEAQVGALSLRVLADADPVFAGTVLAVLAKAVQPC